MSFLYEQIFEEFGRQGIAKKEIPQTIASNLKHNIRPYQEDVFQRFLLWQEMSVGGYAPHLLFNMATGSGKTLIMAGLMLVLHEQGHRNFLFFVNSNNIIRKTKDNFVNATTSKYLFTESININSKEVLVKEVDSFEESDDDSINIKFTTVQQLHIDLNNDKENGLTLEDFATQKMILIADEAHHLSAGTSQDNLLGTWESTVERILKANSTNNMLFEFTATIDYDDREIVDKYKNKIICKYGLAQFRRDKYSKEINLIRSHYDEKERIIQSLILNMYRQELAADNNINLKPVILFKAQKTVAQSEANKTLFHKIIDELSATDVINIRKTSGVEVVQKAFRFFDAKRLPESELVERIKENFAEENCISANNEDEKELNQIRLNTLEDKDNPLRAVFAVQKLNEGWDVLNLFDIVRLYETRDSRNNRPGKTTISEAQLIGRGARYFPFNLADHEDPFVRKFDNDVDNDLKVLEELYYHARDDSHYISELKRALEGTGIYEDDDATDLVNLALKKEFKKTPFYKTGKVVFNKKIYPEKHRMIRATCKTFADLKVVRGGFEYDLTSGDGIAEGAFDVLVAQSQTTGRTAKIINLNSIQPHVVKYALSLNPFYRFDNLNKCFAVNSISEFMQNKKYLGGLNVTFFGTHKEVEKITNRDCFLAVRKLFDDIESEIKKDTPEFKVSEPIAEYVHKVFKDKKVRVPKTDSGGQKKIVGHAKWYAYNDNYGTSEERYFVKMFAGYFDQIDKKYNDVYLVRNEREVKITNKEGQTFQPDFLLFCRPIQGDNLTYQIFIEPKGEIYVLPDKWKENFLLEIQSKKPFVKIDSGKYQILGLPFYTKAHQSKFEDAFVELLNLRGRMADVADCDRTV